MAKIFDFVLELGVDVVKDKIQNEKMERQIRERLSRFLEKEQRLNTSCSLHEEIDFENLDNYIRGELLEDVKTRLFGTPEERNASRITIINKAVSFASANTRLAKHRVEKLIQTSLDILKKYYRSHVNRDLLFITTEVEEVIQEESREIQGQITGIQEKLDETVLLSLDKNVAYIENGETDKVEENIATFMRTISSKHALFPYYGFGIVDQHLHSVPLTADAERKYPPSIKFTVDKIYIGSEPVDFFNEELVQESYRKQKPITMHVASASKFLGNTLDPIQREATQLVDADAVLPPQPFSPAEPFSIVVDGRTVVDYALMRIREIQDDDSIIWANDDEKNRRIDIEFKVSSDCKRFDFRIRSRDRSIKGMLYYYEIINSISKGGDVTLKNLSNPGDGVRGHLTSTENEGFDQEISLLKKLVVLESYFGVQFQLPITYSKSDYETVDHLYHLSQEGKHTRTWSKLETTFTELSDSEQRISEIENDPIKMVYELTEEVDLFGAHIVLTLNREVEGAKIVDLEKIKQKLAVLENDDFLKIQFIPFDESDHGLCVDYLIDGSSSDIIS